MDKVVAAVHPLTILSIIDHYRRLNVTGAGRVVGALLGTAHGHIISLTSSFAVPFDQDPKDPRASFLDHNYMEAMVDLSKKVSAKERLVGWYKAVSIGGGHFDDLGVDEADRQLASRLSASFGANILLVVDSNGVKAPKTFIYKAEEGILSGLDCALEAEEAELVGVEHLLRGISEAPSGMLSTQITRKIEALHGLDGELEDLEFTLISQLESGNLDQGLLAHVQEMINNLPPEFSQDTNSLQSITEQVTDQLIMTLTSTISQCVMSLHDLINNNLAIGEAESSVTVALK